MIDLIKSQKLIILIPKEVIFILLIFNFAFNNFLNENCKNS